MARAFVIRPFGKKTDSEGKKINFDHVSEVLILPALERVKTKFSGGTTAEIIDQGNIREDMFALILEADLVVCDVTILNANVYYELGIRHALRRKHTVLIKGQPTNDKTPFDLLTDRYLPYQIKAPEKTLDELVATIEAALASERRTDSPIFQMLTGLPPADPKHVQAVPLEFAEEVDRATAANSAGWLRLLASDVENLRFQWPGLRKVGNAQWDIQDYAGARRTWEAVRANSQNDIEANLALANVYERLYRSDKDRTLLESSEQALDRVLEGEVATRKQRTEALTLRGRNKKTLWRLDLDEVEDVDERRSRAMNGALRESYDSYRSAFLDDLNAFYPGVVALQLGILQLALAKADNEAWLDTCDSNKSAPIELLELEEGVAELRVIVPASVRAAIARAAGEDKVWAEISEADVRFLTQNRSKRIIQAYRRALPTDKPFAWDAAEGQLELFASLGVKSDLAQEVIAAIDPVFADRKPNSQAGRPKHTIIFAGHRIDEDGRKTERFPPTSEKLGAGLIRTALEEQLDGEHDAEVLVSGAPGADILAIEACNDLGIGHRICLPMPVNVFSREVFGELDGWRTRFLELVEDATVLELSDREGLPKWLTAANINAWERGNRWVMEMSQAEGAKKVTLVALYDNESTGDDLGGTAQMVQLARAAGGVRVKLIDADQLLTGTQ